MNNQLICETCSHGQVCLYRYACEQITEQISKVIADYEQPVESIFAALITCTYASAPANIKYQP